MKIQQYPLNADRTPMDLEVGVITDETGNGGARLADPPVGPDGAPIDAKGLVLIDKDGNFPTFPMAGGLMALALFTAAASASVPLGTNAVQTSGYSVAGKGGASYVYDAAVDAAYVAANPRTSFVTVNNRGFKLNEVVVEPEMVGAQGGGGVDDGPALQAWLDIGGHLTAPKTRYLSNQKLIVRKYINLSGAGYGFSALLVNGTPTLGYELQPGTAIYFPVGVGGLDIQPQTTELDVATAVAAGVGGYTQEGSASSIINNLALIGAGTGAAATGLYCRTSVSLFNVHVIKFQGKGFDFSGSDDIPDGNSEYGQPSLSTLRNCRATSNGSHGFHIRGRNANGSLFKGCAAQLNGGWGFLDESLLGNTYQGGQASTNALGSYKCTGGVANSIYTGCYVEMPEPGFMEPDLSFRCIVDGGYLASAAAQFNVGSNGEPTINDASGIYTYKAQFHWNAPEGVASPAEIGLIFRGADRGLCLQGCGSGTYDLTVNNKNGAPVWAVQGGTQTTRHFGPIQIDFNYLYLNGAVAHPGAPLGATVGLLFSHATDGASLTGNGSAYDVSLRNRNNALAAGVIANTVNMVFAGSAGFAGAVTVPDEAYGPAWDNSLQAPTKNAIYDKLEGQANLHKRYTTLLDNSGSHIAGRVAGTYGFSQGQPLAITGTGILYPLDIIYLDPAEYAAIDGLTAKLRIRCTLLINDVAPTGNYVVGLHPVTRPASSGGAGLIIHTIGAAVAGSTVSFNTPAADAILNQIGADFNVPAAGFYCVGMVSSATVAASSHMHFSALLQQRYA